MEKILSGQLSFICPGEKDQSVDLLCQREYLTNLLYAIDETSATSFLTSSVLYSFINSSQIKTVFLCWVLRESSQGSVLWYHLTWAPLVMLVNSTASSAFSKEFQGWPVFSSWVQCSCARSWGVYLFLRSLMCILMCLDLKGSRVLLCFREYLLSNT